MQALRDRNTTDDPTPRGNGLASSGSDLDAEGARPHMTDDSIPSRDGLASVRFDVDTDAAALVNTVFLPRQQREPFWQGKSPSFDKEF